MEKYKLLLIYLKRTTKIFNLQINFFLREEVIVKETI